MKKEQIFIILTLKVAELKETYLVLVQVCVMHMVFLILITDTIYL